MEERDRLIRQLKSENQQNTGPSPELEKLRAEHAQCTQQIQQKQQQLETLMKQLEDQAEEILSTKIEALTAALAEKNANIALIETSGSTNASAQQAVSQLQTERDQMQKQLRQLSFARDALTEQRKMR
uniref:ERC protein 2 n=4 Tax=Schistocephalus solidus TaxID=70667 RepID=A0A0X3PFX1_SCHSO